MHDAVQRGSKGFSDASWTPGLLTVRLFAARCARCAPSWWSVEGRDGACTWRQTCLLLYVDAETWRKRGGTVPRRAHDGRWSNLSQSFFGFSESLLDELVSNN